MYYGVASDGACMRWRLRSSLTHLEVRSLRCSTPPLTAPPAGAQGRNLLGKGLGTSSHVPLGELATAAVPVEAADEDIRELAVDSAPIVGQVAGPTVRDACLAIDREDLVIGLPRTRLVRIGEPGRDDPRATGHRFIEWVERVAHVGGDQVADDGSIEEPPGIDVAVEPGLE